MPSTSPRGVSCGQMVPTHAIDSAQPYQPHDRGSMGIRAWSKEVLYGPTRRSPRADHIQVNKH